jgi:hypothetical protein
MISIIKNSPVALDNFDPDQDISQIHSDNGEYNRSRNVEFQSHSLPLNSPKTKAASKSNMNKEDLLSSFDESFYITGGFPEERSFVGHVIES